MTAAIGMAIYPVDGKRYDELLKAADFTMYGNKPRNRAASGRSRAWRVTSSLDRIATAHDTSASLCKATDQKKTRSSFC
jgi:predicted signal transduction protein with EAL and GGDEF domain